MARRKRPNREATKSEKFMYKWGADLLHLIVWTICISLNICDVLGNLPKNSQQGIQVIAVFVALLLELAISFLKIACERKIKVVDIRIFKVIALFVMIVALALIAIGAHIMRQGSNTQNITIAALIGVFATTKGLEMWILHNLDKYNREIRDGSGDYESTFEEDEEKK